MADRARAVAPLSEDLPNGGSFRIPVKSEDEHREFPGERLRHPFDGPMSVALDIDFNQIGQSKPTIGDQFVKADGFDYNRSACG